MKQTINTMHRLFRPSNWFQRVVILMLFSVMASAHHSRSEYSGSPVQEIEGEVVKISNKNGKNSENGNNNVNTMSSADNENTAMNLNNNNTDNSVSNDSEDDNILQPLFDSTIESNQVSNNNHPTLTIPSAFSDAVTDEDK